MQVNNSASPPQSATVGRTVVVVEECVAGEVRCAGSFLCSIDGVCNLDGPGVEAETAAEETPPSLQLIGPATVEIKQVGLPLRFLILAWFCGWSDRYMKLYSL